MTNKYKILLRMQLYNLFGINRLLHSHDKHEKQRSVVIAVLGLIAGTIFIIYVARFSNMMAKAGMEEMIPTLMVIISSLTTLVLTFMKSTGILIGLKDYDMVMSMPVSIVWIVTSRITLLYFINFIICFVAMIPSSIVYIIYTRPSFSVFFFLFGALLFTPVIPMIFSFTLGVIIVAISSRTKYNHIFSLVLSTVVVLLIVFMTTKMQLMDADEITNLGGTLANILNKLYPPASLISVALSRVDWGSFVLFISISLLMGFLFVGVVSHYYKFLNTAIFSHHVNKNYRIGKLKDSSAFMALYKKEFRRLISCTIYALNSCIGIVLLLVISVFAIFFFSNTLKEQLEVAGLVKDISDTMPIVLSIFVSITSTTAASLSLEGKNRWIMCSVPVSSKTVFDSKIAVNLTVILPPLYVSIFIVKWIFPYPIQTILIFIIPTVYAFFVSVLGMYLNIKFPKYDWNSEYYAVKGGAISVLATVGSGMVSSLIPLCFCIIIPKYREVIMLGCIGLLLTITIIIYLKIIKIPLYI